MAVPWRALGDPESPRQALQCHERTQQSNGTVVESHHCHQHSWRLMKKMRRLSSQSTAKGVPWDMSGLEALSWAMKFHGCAMKPHGSAMVPPRELVKVRENP